MTPPKANGHYRIEIGPVGVEMVDFCERLLLEGWELLTFTTVPVNTAAPTPLVPNPPQVLGLMMVFRRKGKAATAAETGPEQPRLAIPVLETLASHVRAALPLMGLQGILRDKLEQSVAAAEAFLQQPA